MKQMVDLHLHSNASLDGELSPEAVILKCAEAGLDTVALTDHNTVRGVAQAKLAARLHGIRVISGIEIDCVLSGQSLHILGYGIDEERTIFSDVEENIVRQERHAGGLRIELLRKCGIQIDGAWLCSHANNGIVTGELIAEAALSDSANIHNPLMQPYQPGGQRSDSPYLHFYWDYCTYGKPAYVPIRYMQAREALQIIHSCGGVAVLAHPGVNLDHNAVCIHELIDMGLDGIEVYSSYHTPKQTAHYKSVANENAILQTCGSDFHGKTKPDIQIGDVPCKDGGILAEILLERLRERTPKHIRAAK